MTEPQHRVVPNFLIIGGQKCGTTALAQSLRRHPQVFIPAAKEAHHFGTVSDATAGGPEYWQFFAAWAGQPHTGEATPNYLTLPTAPAQIRRLLPEIKLIVSLRNPVSRAYSAYWHGVREGAIRSSFADAVADQSRGVALDRPWQGFVQDGRYLRHLLEYEHLFGRDRMHVILHEDLTAAPRRTLDGVAAFLGLGEPALEIPRSSNVTSRSLLPAWMRATAAGSRALRHLHDRTLRPFEPPPMPSMIRAALVEFYRADNDELAEWLGRDLTGWSS